MTQPSDLNIINKATLMALKNGFIVDINEKVTLGNKAYSQDHFLREYFNPCFTETCVNSRKELSELIRLLLVHQADIKRLGLNVDTLKNFNEANSGSEKKIWC